ncbi:unnamed protein product [Adineta ricciae]|uniref:Kinesin light chain n=1 Tax=Adineta ricciae TaxID=249248 RepID=A0A814PI88_ADIRI|nr:unnamed protein product [Adineta ricciae]
MFSSDAIDLCIEWLRYSVFLAGEIPKCKHHLWIRKMNEEDILQSTRFVIQGLDALKTEHGKILETLAHSPDYLPANTEDEQVGILKKSMDLIDLGIGEAQVMMQLNHHLRNFEAEKQKLLTQVRRLCQENAWLRDELGSTQKKLHECEQINASCAVELEHLKFLKDVKLFDNTDDDTSAKNQQSNGQDLVRDLFPFDENDNEQDSNTDDQQISLKNCGSYVDLMKLPTQTTNGSVNSISDYHIPDRLKTLHNLVIQYASQGRYEVAVPLCRQALEDLEKTSGHEHPDVATMLNILALVYRDQANYVEATTLLNEALIIRENTLGPDHPVVAATLNNLAVLYGKRNRFNEAEPLCKRALKIREKCLGPQHPDVAKQLNNLALLCQNQGKYDEVQSYYKRAIDIYTKSLGPYDINVDKTINNLASAYIKQQKYIEAEQLYKDTLVRAYEKTVQTPKPNSTPENSDLQSNWYKSIQTDAPIITTTLKNLSSLYRRQGRYDAADTLDNYASRSTKDPQAIIQAFYFVTEKNPSV